MNKVLIFTAWNPTKSRCAPQYFEGVSRLLESGIPVELFIDTALEDSASKSTVRAMAEGEMYAKAAGFTHVLNVAMEKVPGPSTLIKGLEDDKPVLLFNRDPKKEGLEKLSYQSLVENDSSWDVMLVRTSVLERAPLSSAYVGDYISPDRAWFKKVLHQGVEVWRDNGLHIKTLMPPPALVVAGGL